MRFRFGAFLVSSAHRTIRRGDVDIPLIPRYFDLLMVLLTDRHRVVTRHEILDRVWGDVVVSDGALSQAVRTIRRSLGDDSREPQFIRTVARHGYQFVGVDVIEVSDDGPMPTVGLVVEPPREEARRERLLACLTRRAPFDVATEDERREAAEELHALGTAEALRLLDAAPGHAEARAMLRDARWDVPGAGDVPVLGAPGWWIVISHLVRLRLRRAARHASNRWGTAAVAGMVSGALAGAIGGVSLWLAPSPDADGRAVLALAVVGAVAGGAGAAGVGAGLAAAEALARSARAVALACSGALGGAFAGLTAHALANAMLAGMFGRDVPGIGGWFEGLVLGGAAGIGYGRSTSPLPGGGLAGPRGTARLRTALLTGAACAVAAVALTVGGRHLVGASLDVMASAFDGSDVGLAPLARLLGEEELRPMTRTLVAAFEGAMFGAGLAFGLTHRPRRL